MRTDPPDRVEVDMTIAKLKRDKAEGTDEVSVNLNKELTSDNRQEVVKVLGAFFAVVISFQKFRVQSSSALEERKKMQMPIRMWIN